MYFGRLSEHSAYGEEIDRDGYCKLGTTILKTTPTSFRHLPIPLNAHSSGSEVLT